MNGSSGDVSGPSEHGLAHISGYEKDALSDAIDRYFWRDPPQAVVLRTKSQYAMGRKMWREWWRRVKAGETA